MASLGPWLGGRRAFDPFSYDVWDPFVVSRGIWDRSGGKQGGQDETLTLAQANVDWIETENAHIFRADLPGVRKEELKVQVEDGNVLHISGEKIEEEEYSDDTWHTMERRRGRFVRRFRLPESANLEEIKCSMKHGVLTVTVPRKDMPRPNVRLIDIA